MKRLKFESGDGTRLIGILSSPPEGQGSPLVIASHGLLSDKGSSKYVELSERLLDKGISLFRFDFRGCGESQGNIGGSILSDRLSDLDAALAFMRGEGYKGRIGLFGSSFGGIVSIIAAARRSEEISRLAVWSTPARFGELFSGLKDIPRGEGELWQLGSPNEFISDLRRWNFLEKASRVSGTLVVHGMSDAVVPVNHAETLYSYLRNPKEKLILEEANHTISGREHREKAMTVTINWLREGFDLS